MMVCLSFIFNFRPKYFVMVTVVMNPVLPHIVNPTSQQNIYEGDEKGGQEPELNHLDVGGEGEAGHHRDEHTGQHQHYGQVHSYCRLKVEGFEVACDVADDVQK